MALLCVLLTAGCAALTSVPKPVTQSPMVLLPFEATTTEVVFEATDGVQLAGQLDRPPGRPSGRPSHSDSAPLVFIVHHSGPVDRDAYQYLAARLVPAGYAVFRFDKRGTGRSGGEYGCCEATDALAAYRSALQQQDVDSTPVFIVAQSIGTKIVAENYTAFARIHQPMGVVLLSNLLAGREIKNIDAPTHLIVSDSEPNMLDVTKSAALAHRQRYDADTSYYIAEGTEHTLFDISDGPIDWQQPDWPLKFHQGAWVDLKSWLDTHVAAAK